jgi:hypothetical protein
MVGIREGGFSLSFSFFSPKKRIGGSRFFGILLPSFGRERVKKGKKP